VHVVSCQSELSCIIILQTPMRLENIDLVVSTFEASLSPSLFQARASALMIQIERGVRARRVD
jgi:hypothetical protein